MRKQKIRDQRHNSIKTSTYLALNLQTNAQECLNLII